MYDNRSAGRGDTCTLPSQTLTASGKTSDTVGYTPPPEPDNFDMLNRDERAAMMTSIGGPVLVSPRTLTIAPPMPASPTLSDADSEALDDGSNSPCSFTGEECPDLCGGPKSACRSWTPPASPFYYTNENGIFLLDDRQNYAERQKIEMEHTLRDLDARLQRLRDNMSPPRYLSMLHETENSRPSSPIGNSHGLIDSLPRSPTEGLPGHSRVTMSSPQPCPCGCDGTLCRYKLLLTQNASADSSNHTINTEEKGELGTADLGDLIHTHLQHVQSTNSPPRYLAYVSETETETQPLPRGPIAILNSREKRRDEALSMRHASPQLHLGNTAYPTPLPSSPESKPSRKRGRDDGSQEDSDRKRRREEDDERIPTPWRLRNA